MPALAAAMLIRPLLLTLTRWPGVNASITPVAACSSLVLSRFSVPVPDALSPSLSVPPRDSCAPLRMSMVSQLGNTAGSPAWVLSRVSVSLPRPPSTHCAAASWARVRLCNDAVSSPGPAITGAWRLPPVQVNRSLPKLSNTWPLTSPPETVTRSLPPLTLILPPITLVPDTSMVSLPNPVTRLPTMVPALILNTLSSSFISTRPMVPPVIVPWSPSSKAPVMVPPLISNSSRPSPWASEAMVPSVMTKRSWPEPWTIAPAWPPLTSITSLPSP
ncbi:hypothetical protein [Pseudomonas sp. 22 E 5]|nr:hypothetical protein [Pseudomonas sp. 22 E 5]